jgi:hypothetical protein
VELSWKAGDSSFAYPWLIWLLAALVVVVLLVAALLRWRRLPSHPTYVAHAARLRALPRYRALVVRRTVLAAFTTAFALIACLGGVILAGRLQQTRSMDQDEQTRDIMLCLDVSGSMSEVDVEVLSVFEELLESFKGERIGLTIFNSSPVQIFPLTDDYPFVQQHLQSIRESFDYIDEIPEHWVGTLNGDGASLIGDGLAACALAFDHPDDERSRSIIFATDNEVNGASIVTLDEAAGYAKSVGVRVFALNPVQGKDADVSAELAKAAETTGGAAYGLRDTTTVGDIVAEVQKQEATELKGQARVVWTDTPNLWIVVLMIAMLSFVVVLWRVKL